LSHEQKSLSSPEKVLDMELGRIEIVSINGGGIGRATFQPGWKWSQHERPVVNGGEYCEVPHFVFLVAGSLHIVMADGDEFDLRAGDVATLPAGHDGWVTGNEPAVMLDFAGVAK
jgi:hypothetical protein